MTGLIGKELLLLSYPVADRKLKRQQLGELMLVEYSGALILCPDNELAGTYRNIPPGPYRDTYREEEVRCHVSEFMLTSHFFLFLLGS